MFLRENLVSDLSLHVLWAPALYVMGGRQLFLSHVCLSYTCTGSSARCYGIRASQGQEPSNELTAWTLLIPRINMLGLTIHLFFAESASQLHKHAHDVYLQHLYKYINVCLCPCAFNSPLLLLHIGFPLLRSLSLALTVCLAEQINITGQPLHRLPATAASSHPSLSAPIAQRSMVG